MYNFCKSKTVRYALASVLVLMGINEAAAQELTPVTLAVATQDINLGYPEATLPAALGYYEEEGLKVEIVPGQSTSVTAQLLLTGRADLGILSPDAITVQRARSGIALKSVYAISRRSGFRIGVPKDSPIKEISDLKGTTLGVSDLGASSVVYLRARFREAGLDTSDMHTVAIGYGAPAAEALLNGTVGSMTTFSGAWTRYANSGYEFRFLPDARFQNSVYSYNLYVTDDYLEKNKDIIVKVGRAIAKSQVFLRTNPEAAVRLFWKQYPDRAPKDPNDPVAFKNDLAILKARMGEMRLMELPVDFKWGSQDDDVWKLAQDTLVQAKQIETPIPQGEFYTDEFSDAYNDFDHAAVIRQAEQWQQ